MMKFCKPTEAFNHLSFPFCRHWIYRPKKLSLVRIALLEEDHVYAINS